MSKSPQGRLPDFVIIGAMKAGTTSVFRWLEQQPEIALPDMKEPRFFSHDENWARGQQWYEALFPSTATLTGEASVAYTSLDRAEVSATRMVATIPSARLIYVVRDPVERLRSHYRHELLRGRETRSLEEALRDPANAYVGSSRCWSCIEPYVRRFPRSALLIVSSEDLFSDHHTRAWDSVTAHLGLPPRPRPEEAHNVSADKPQFTPTMLRLWESGLLRRRPPLPPVLRRVARRVLLREGSRRTVDLDSSQAAIPGDVEELLRDEFAQLERWLGGPPA